MSWQEQKDIILAFFAAGVGGWFVYEMRELRLSVQGLTKELAHALTSLEFHGERLKDHHERIRHLEHGGRK